MKVCVVEASYRRDEGGFWAAEGEDCGGGGEAGGVVGEFSLSVEL